MLKKLIVSNLALVKFAEIDFTSGLNIISGETGSGKSILIDGLMLLLGQRYDKTFLRFGAKSGFVEGVFDGKVSSILTDIGLEEDDYIIINRKFDECGKNDIHINGRQITLSMLKNITSKLIDIYGQNEYHSLTKKSEHLRILDGYAGSKLSELMQIYYEKRSEYRQILDKLNDLGDEDERKKSLDFLSYQIEEIEKANIKENEEDDLIVRRKRLLNAQNLIDSLSKIYQLLNGNSGISEKISEIKQNLQFMSRIDGKYTDLLTRINSIDIEIDDISETINDDIDEFSIDESIDEIENRLNLIRSLKRKYGDYNKMIEFHDDAKERYDLLSNCDAIYEKLLSQKKNAFLQLKNSAEILSDFRKKCSIDFQNSIVSQLKDLGMNGAKFEIIFNNDINLLDDEIYTSSGIDEIEFYLSPNAGQPLKPLIKIISGGEMSRFMLALKVISGEVNDIQTMIFDEIDAGISGIIGQEVAKKLYQISVNKQVICITHLPQIAAMADNHLFIRKRVIDEETVTEITVLDENGCIKEVSRLSGSENISPSSLSNAAEMISWSKEYKKIN